MRFSETQIEQTIDRMVWTRLRTDSAWLNAENAEEQSKREEEITQECERMVRNRARRLASGIDILDEA